MPCSATSQLTNAVTVPLPLTMPTTNSQWSIFVQRLVDFLTLTRDAANRTGVNVVPAAYALYDAPTLPLLTIVGATGALDATKTLFGNASLKLTATAATVTVQFTGSPITLAPYLRWIESVYIQSSRTSITGTLAVMTAVQSYPVDISGTLTPAMWGRLYGDCDLTADDSSSATILLTLTGCTVGDTFNLEGWQLEAASGATNLPSAFVNSAAAGSLDSVPDGSGYARVNSAHVSGGVAYNYKGVWSSATAYVKGDETVYSGSYWLALADNTNSAPAQGNANWQVVGAYNNYQGAWSSTTTYYAGQETTYNGNYWVATATNTNSAPSTSNANWIIAGPQNLDKIADGSSRFAVINGASLGGVAQTDSNDLAIIDFSQTAHVNKTVDHLNDGTTYARTKAAALTSGNVDLSKAGVVSKTLDYIADSATYLRTIQQSNSAGAQTIDNPTFAQGLAGWVSTNANAYLQGAAPSPAIGSQYVVVQATAANGFIASNRKYACNPGDVVSVGGLAYAADGTASINVAFYTSAGAFISGISSSTGAAAWTALSASGAVPSTAAYFILTCVQVTSGDFALFNYVWCSVNDVRQPNSAKAYVNFSDNTSGGHVGKHLDNIGDGPSGNRSAIGNADIFVSGGINRIGLRVAGSGHRPGNMHNSLQRAVTNVPASVPASPSYSASAGSPATATISVPAFTAQAGSASTSYNSSSVSVTGSGGTTVTYYLYFNDPGFAGGTQTLNATTNGATIYAGDGYVYVGSIAVTFPTSGSGSGSGSGGGGACVTVGSFGPAGRFDADTTEVMTPAGPAKVRRAIVSPQKCVRVECENGAVLECSEDAPLMTPRGRVHAVYALGRKIQTSAGRSRVVGVTRIGIREIVAIDAGDIAFYAGESQDGPFILHHNKIIP